jgi:hypothetical protein
LKLLAQHEIQTFTINRELNRWKPPLQGLFCRSYPPGRLTLTARSRARHLAGIFLRQRYLQTESRGKPPRGDSSRMVNGAARFLRGSSNLILRAEIWIVPHPANTVLMQVHAKHRRVHPPQKKNRLAAAFPNSDLS